MATSEKFRLQLLQGLGLGNVPFIMRNNHLKSMYKIKDTQHNNSTQTGKIEFSSQGITQLEICYYT